LPNPIESPALAFGFLCSVFKVHDRRGHAHQMVRWCLGPPFAGNVLHFPTVRRMA